MRVLAVFHHYEPTLQSLGTAYIPSLHRPRSRLKYLLDQDRPIRKTLLPTVRRNGTGRCVNDVQLAWTLAWRIRHCPTAEELVRRAITGRHPQISIRVNHPSCGRIFDLSFRLSMGSD